MTEPKNFLSSQMPEQEIEMDSDQKEIGYFAIEDGDNLFVHWES